MTDPNDTPALDLGCGDSGCVVARSGGMSTNGGCGCVPRVGRPMTPEVRAELRRILTVRREQVDGLVARIAALTAERDAYKRAKAEHAERVVELNKTCNYLERTALDAAQRVETAEAERDAALARVRELEARPQHPGECSGVCSCTTEERDAIRGGREP